MDQKTIVLAIVGTLIVASAAAGIYIVMNDDDNDGAVTDMLGRSIDVPDTVDKVVCLSAGSARLVTYMGAADKIVAVDDYDASLKGGKYTYATYRLASDLTSVTSVGSEENFTAISETGADLIITSITEKAEVDQLQKSTGITTVAVAADGSITIEDKDFEKDIRLVGKVLHLEERADELIDGVKDMLDDIRGIFSSSTSQPKCYVGGMFYYMKGDLYKTTGNYIAFDLAKAENVSKNVNRGIPYDIDSKTLNESGAEYVFVDNITLSASQTIFNSDKTNLQDLPAVKNKEFYSTYTYKMYGTNWESELMNAYYIGSVIHSDCGYNADEKVSGVLKLFYGDSVTLQMVKEKQGGAEKLDSWFA